jgi:hypothetical protein
MLPLLTYTKMSLSIVVNRSLRIVYMARNMQHAIQLQSQLPTSLVAIPSHIPFQDVERYQGHLRLPTLCATAGLLHPLRSMDILRYTPCTKLLLRNLLLEFDDEKTRVLWHEEVERCMA